MINVSLGWPNQPSTSATQAIAHTGQRLQGISTDAPTFIRGDLINCKQGKSVGNFWPVCDLCDMTLLNVWIFFMVPLKGAYKSLRRAPLGESEHNVYLVPSYKPGTSWNEDSFQFGRRGLYNVSRIVTPAQIGFLICWLLDFLTVRSQRLRVNGVLWDVLFSSIGWPQGSVLSPLLFILYTNSCQSSYEKRHILKFAND